MRSAFSCRTFVLMRPDKDAVSWAKRQGAEVVLLSPDAGDEHEEAAGILRSIKADWFLIDLPYPGLEQAIGSFAREFPTIVLDDFRFLDLPAAAIVNSSVHAPAKIRRLHACTRYFLGPNYFIIDEEAAQKPGSRTEQRFNVVLSFGGSDPVNLTAAAVQALSRGEWPSDVLFRIIMGPGYRGIEEVKDIVKGDARFCVEIAPDHLLPLLKGADFAVCSGGRTLYELHALDIPCLPVASIEHEAAAIAEFRAQGLITEGLLQWDEKLFLAALRKRLAG